MLFLPVSSVDSRWNTGCYSFIFQYVVTCFCIIGSISTDLLYFSLSWVNQCRYNLIVTHRNCANFCSNNLMMRHINGKMKFEPDRRFFLPHLRVFHSPSPYTFRPVTSIRTWATAPRLGKRYLTFMLFECLLMQVYVGDLSERFINVKIELRKSFNPRSGSLEIPFTISAVSIEDLKI